MSESDNIIENLGPLAALAGIWEGDQGIDVAPGKDGPVESLYRERIVFEPMGPVKNGIQELYGLRYSTTAWPLNEDDPFHEELGYWMWDAYANQVMRCFMVPRVVTVNAIGTAAANDKAFSLSANAGSEIAGILSNPFLDKAFKTVRYELDVNIHDDGSFSYFEDTQLQVHGFEALFHHTDKNRLQKVSD
ncbi:heme-binding beta-barrel domain-containing protein [Mariprofundus micogutta]|nr:heme-binding beta-barrel domain-containing protein [Mariprofundus micogutta]